MVSFISSLRLALLLFCLLVSRTGLTQTASDLPVQHFDLPAQALSSALIEFALQAHVSVIADQSLLEGLRSSPLIGPGTPAKAIDSLLANTPLRARYDERNKSFTLVPRRKSGEKSRALRPTIEEPEIQEEIVVTGALYPFRYNTITNTQLHGDIPYFDSARFVNVLPETLIEDRQAKEIADLTQYASAITPGDGLSDSNDDMVIRGFQRHALYIDGYRLSSSTGVKMLPANIQQVEILKGPSTLLYGQAEPGGIVNVVRKRPGAVTQFDGSFGGGSANHQYVDLDVNYAYSESLRFRTIGLLEKKDEAGDVSDIDRRLLATSMSWRLGNNTWLDVGYDYSSADQVWNRNVETLLPYEGIFPGASLDQLTNNARKGYQSRFNLGHLAMNHYLSGNWRLRGQFVAHTEYRYGIRNTGEQLLQTDLLYKRSELGDDFFMLLPGGQLSIPIVIDADSGSTFYTLAPVRSIYDENEEDNGSLLHVKLEGSVETGVINHRLSAGTSWQRQQLYKRQLIEAQNFGYGQWWDEYQFGQVMLDTAAQLMDPNRPLGSFEEHEQELDYTDYGFYLQDTLEFNERWLLSLGSRYTVTQGEYRKISSDAERELPEYRQISSQAGLIYKLPGGSSLFANFSEAMRANYRLDDLGSQVDEPELSNQFELGVKSLLFNGRIMGSLAVYDINKENVIDVRVYEGVRTLVAGDNHRVQGLDMDLSWQLSPDINLIAALSMLESEVVTGEFAGNHTPLAADSTASLFANYRWDNLYSLSFGVKYVGERYADLANRFAIDAYTTMDFAASINMRLAGFKPSLKLAVNNLADTRYYTAVLGGVRENLSEGRNFLLSLEVAY